MCRAGPPAETRLPAGRDFCVTTASGRGVPRPVRPNRSLAFYGSGMPVPDFEPSGIEYVYAEVAAHIEARIAAGELAPGARLANERNLAGEYQVALGTIRRAVEVLKAKGLVTVRPSKGVFIARQP